MRLWLVFVTEYAIVIIDALALVIIVIGTIEASMNGLRLIFRASTGHERRSV